MSDLSDPSATWQLRLYVAGQTPRALTAYANLQKICEEHLAGRYEIEVIDLRENPQLARGDEIIHRRPVGHRAGPRRAAADRPLAAPRLG